MNSIIQKEDSYYDVPKPRLQVKHLWNPQDLGKEIPMFESKHRPYNAQRNRMTSTCPGATFDWTNPKTTVPSRCRSELLAERKRMMLDANEAHRPPSGDSRPSSLRSSNASLRSSNASHKSAMPVIERPIFGINEAYSTATQSSLIGYRLDEARIKPAGPYAKRLPVFPETRVTSYNGPNHTSDKHPYQTSRQMVTYDTTGSRNGLFAPRHYYY